MRVALLVPRIHLQAGYVLRALVPRARRGLDRYLLVTTPKLPPGQAPFWSKLSRHWRTSGPEYIVAMAAASAAHLATGALERLVRRPVERRRSLTVLQAARLLGAEEVRATSVEEPPVLDRLRGFRPDLICAVFFNQYVPAALRSLPRLGAVNLHPSFLPDYRGVSPCFWALARGERSTGVTIHRMTGEMDRGAILAQARVEIAARDTLHSLYRRAAIRGGELLLGLLSEPGGLVSPADPPGGGRVLLPGRHPRRGGRVPGAGAEVLLGRTGRKCPAGDFRCTDEPEPADLT